MPLIDVTLAEGRDPAMVRELIRELTDAAERALRADRSTIRVLVRELPLEHWANGGVTLRESRSERTGSGTRSPGKATT